MIPARHSVALISDASGNQTTYTNVVNGRILAIRYVPDGTNPLATGADFTITGETTGIPIITITNIGTSAVSFAPRMPTCGLTGTASLYAAGGLGVEDVIPIANERIKIVMAQGGNVLQGTLHFIVG